QGDEQLVDALVFDQLLEKRLRLAAVVSPQELTHGIERDLPLEIHVDVVQEVPYELFHGSPPQQAIGSNGPGTSPYSRRGPYPATENTRIACKIHPRVRPRRVRARSRSPRQRPQVLRFSRPCTPPPGPSPTSSAPREHRG